MKNSKRYKDFTSFVRDKFGFRVQKVCINAGFTCPNKDGSKGIGGCTYCNNNTFNPDYCKPIKPINQQIKEGIEFCSLPGATAFVPALINSGFPNDKFVFEVPNTLNGFQ